MTKSEIVNFVLTKLGLDKNNAEIVAHAKSAIKQIHDNIWNAKDWLATMNTLVIANAEEIERLPHYVQSVLAASYNNAQQFRIREQQDVLLLNPEVFDTTSASTGTIGYMEYSPTVGVLVSPNGGTISVASSNAGDNGVISVVGVKNGEDAVEEITLNGTSYQSSVNSYDEIYTLSKPETTGTVTVKDSIGTTIQTLLAHETARIHKRVKLYEAPTEATKTLVLLVKMNPVGFINDSDSPMLNNIDGILKKALEAEMLEFDEQYDKAVAADKKANNLFAVKLDNENNSQERNITISMEPQYCTTSYRRSKKYL